MELGSYFGPDFCNSFGDLFSGQKFPRAELITDHRIAKVVFQSKNMNFDLILLGDLRKLSDLHAEENYEALQKECAEYCRNHYASLVDVAYDYEQPSIRIAALEMICHLNLPDAKTILNDLRIGDPEMGVKKHAEGLLFRLVVNDHIAAFSESQNASKH